MATAQGTSVKGRQLLINVPNPTAVITVKMRGASLGQTGKLGWLALEQVVSGNPNLQMSGQEWWRDGIRWAFAVSITNVQCVVYWRKAGLLWQIDTA